MNVNYNWKKDVEKNWLWLIKKEKGMGKERRKNVSSRWKKRDSRVCKFLKAQIMWSKMLSIQNKNCHFPVQKKSVYIYIYAYTYMRVHMCTYICTIYVTELEICISRMSWESLHGWFYSFILEVWLHYRLICIYFKTRYYCRCFLKDFVMK